MVFRRIRAVLGGGTTVDTVVHTPLAQPGGRLEGVVEIVGGSGEQDVRRVALALSCRVEVETRDHERGAEVVFAEQLVAGGFGLRPEERRALPFSIEVPWETPFTAVGGEDLPGVRLGLRTSVEIARSTDVGDFDPIRVAPLPAQQRVLAALERLGCRFRRSDVEHGQISGAVLPFYQELEFTPPPALERGLSEVEVTFLARSDELEVILEGDRRGGLFTDGGDRVRRLLMDYGFVDSPDLQPHLEEQLGELARRSGPFS